VTARSPANDPLRSVSIALSILDCFGVSSELGPSAVAREVGIAKSTASRMLAVLAAHGVLERHGPGRYRLGLRMFEFGQLALSRLNLFEVSVPVLAALRDRVRDLVQLGVPMGAEVLFLDRFEAQGLDPRFHGQQWRRVPAHSSSSGRAIAAFNPTVARSMFEAGLIRRTRYTVVEPRRLGEILAEIRRRGYAATHEELEEGIPRWPRPSSSATATTAGPSPPSRWPDPLPGCSAMASPPSPRARGRPRITSAGSLPPPPHRCPLSNRISEPRGF
jgi:IclR family transcriptional regulator, KDG regulon repressor